jgi:hypothetical protein
MSNVFYVEYELRLKKQLISNVFYVEYELRLKKELSVECFVRGVRAEAEETVECRMFFMWSTS